MPGVLYGGGGGEGGWWHVDTHIRVIKYKEGAHQIIDIDLELSQYETKYSTALLLPYHVSLSLYTSIRLFVSITFAYERSISSNIFNMSIHLSHARATWTPQPQYQYLHVCNSLF